MTQNDKLLTAFRRGSMTTLAAYKLGIMSFHRILSNLKAEGHKFTSKIEGKGMVQYYRYKIVKD